MRNALARCCADEHDPPSIDLAKPAWLQTALNAGGIALGVILSGLALVRIDLSRPLGSGAGSR